MYAAVGVETPALHPGLKTRWGGVGAGPGDPLPVELVVGDVGVDEMRHEMRRPSPPVEVEVLGQERGDDHAGPVVHEPLPGQLPHGGIHDG